MNVYSLTLILFLTIYLQHVWEEEWGASGDPYIFIGQEQFLVQMEHVINTKDLRKRVARPLPYFFMVSKHTTSPACHL